MFRLNPLSFVEICIPVVGRLTDSDIEEALQFLEKIADKVEPFLRLLYLQLQRCNRLERFFKVCR
jgi:hypothetical protein